MSYRVADSLQWIEERVAGTGPIEKIGKVVQVAGILIHSEGPEASLGEICKIRSSRRGVSMDAEVVGFRDNRLLLMPLGDMQNIHPGCEVYAEAGRARVPTGPGLLGRVIDGLGRPMDDLGPLRVESKGGVDVVAPDPIKREPINIPFETGIRAIDAFTPLGRGQRMGIFSGSGVGKSTLLGMIARGTEADINVIAMVGERGRELREFIDNDLGEEGRKRSVVVVSTSDQSAPLRVRAALLATAIAESFRFEGASVLLLLDSITRFAMAQREIGLAVGEPPTARGYTPSVFSVLPRLLERTGVSERGAITALYTILVEGDDFNEPIADAVRGILDGHIVLSRELATANFYPPVDVIASVSRLILKVCSKREIELVNRARDLLSVHRRNEDLINIGAYAKGSNAKIDEAIARYDTIMEFIRQPVDEHYSRKESFSRLEEVLG